MFDNMVNRCVAPDKFHGNYCELPANKCERNGIFRNRRNCGRFYTCVQEPDGSYLVKDYACPEGWLFETDVGGPHVTCVPKKEDDGNMCPFCYQIPNSVDADDSTQCVAVGQFGYEETENEDDFIHCKKQFDGDLGQLGPWYCPAGSTYQEHLGICS